MEKEVNPEEVYEVAKLMHKGCTSVCFTVSDVREYIKCRLSGEAFVEKVEGTTVYTKSGVFGNVSYDHFISSVKLALFRLNKDWLLFDP